MVLVAFSPFEALKLLLKASLERSTWRLKAALTSWPKYNWCCHFLLWANAKDICVNACISTQAWGRTSTWLNSTLDMFVFDDPRLVLQSAAMARKQNVRKHEHFWWRISKQDHFCDTYVTLCSTVATAHRQVRLININGTSNRRHYTFRASVWPSMIRLTTIICCIH